MDARDWNAPDGAARTAWANAARRFEYRLDAWPALTLLLVFSFVAMHVASGIADVQSGRASVLGAAFFVRSDPALRAFGARDLLSVRHDEWWRLVTYGFLHGGTLHLALNGTAMLGLGRLCETVFGRVRTLWLFLVTVIAGGVLSQVGGIRLSEGASGGLFGMLGALAAFGWRGRRRLDPVLRRDFGPGLWPWIGVNLVLGFFFSAYVDNLCHIGGLVSGILVGLMLGNRITDNDQGSRVATWAMGLGSVAILVYGFGGLTVGR